MSDGRILFLQGASSAGKSTLASALQVSLGECWWTLEADDITRMTPTSARNGWWNPTPEERLHPSWDPALRLSRWYAGYFGCLAAIARTGSNVIAVGGWLQTPELAQLAATLDGLDALCIGVHCPLEELERREAARGDRPSGYARSQIDLVHTHAPYDAEVNTATQTTEEAVAVIRAVLTSSPAHPFFARIRAQYPTPPSPQ